MKKMLLKTNQNPSTALNTLFKYLLENKVVDALLLPQEVESKTSVVHTLVKDPEQIVSANPLAPLSLVNAARLVSDLTFKSPKEKIGVVLRPCEIKALVELVKLNQANLEQILIIGVDCLGTFHPVDYRRMHEEGVLEPYQWAEKASSGLETSLGENAVRQSCQICDSITPEHADIEIAWVGSDIETEIALVIKDELAPALAGLANLKEGEPAGREEVIAKLQESRLAGQEKILAEFTEKYSNLDNLMADLSTCLKCQNCRKACPICFCRQCVFESPIFEHESDKYLSWASRKGLIEMPADTVLFHLTRLNHMGTSCVGCGQCESACPSKLPLATIFRCAGKKVQELFDYVPGRDIEESLPLSTYKEAELEPR